jgi:hypothetical protein
MTRMPAARLAFSLILLSLITALPAVPAAAQYRPLPTSSYGSAGNPKGEPYHIEFGFNAWNPEPNITIESESLGIPGTDINAKADLGIARTWTYGLDLVLRPAKKHKFRFNYIPQKYDADTTLTGEIIFNGISFPISTRVGTHLQWNTYRFGYEYDFVSRAWGFVGMILEAKYTDVNFELSSPIIGTEFVRAKAPIPAIGGIGRANIGRYVSVTGEFTAFKLPDSVSEDYRAHYYEWDIYGMINFTNNLGAKVGFRSHDLSYEAKEDRGSAQLRGMYVGGVVRF